MPGIKTLEDADRRLKAWIGIAVSFHTNDEKFNVDLISDGLQLIESSAGQIAQSQKSNRETLDYDLSGKVMESLYDLHSLTSNYVIREKIMQSISLIITNAKPDLLQIIISNPSFHDFISIIYDTHSQSEVETDGLQCLVWIED
eukprot:GHVP01046880.1.p1 GENE.GHVP01046880.1~~GHVP01046880.1.p1  ORF type:complete len:144 (-),score=24.15 GHVP01046880.1:67-498(-)